MLANHREKKRRIMTTTERCFWFDECNQLVDVRSRTGCCSGCHYKLVNGAEKKRPTQNNKLAPTPATPKSVRKGGREASTREIERVFPLDGNYHREKYGVVVRANDVPNSVCIDCGREYPSSSFYNHVCGKGTMDGKRWKVAHQTHCRGLKKSIPMIITKTFDGKRGQETHRAIFCKRGHEPRLFCSLCDYSTTLHNFIYHRKTCPNIVDGDGTSKVLELYDLEE